MSEFLSEPTQPERFIRPLILKLGWSDRMFVAAMLYCDEQGYEYVDFLERMVALRSVFILAIRRLREMQRSLPRLEVGRNIGEKDEPHAEEAGSGSGSPGFLALR